MEVVSLTSDDESPGHAGTKRFLQGRPLPSIPIDSVATPSNLNNSNSSHPGARYPGFRPHQRRLSLQKNGGQHQRGDGTSTPCDSGVSFSSPEGDPPHYASSTVTKSFGGVSSRSKVARTPKNTKKKRPVASSSATPAATGGGSSGAVGGGGGAGGGVAATAGGGGAGLVSSTSSGVSSSRTSERVNKRAPQRVSQVSQLSHHGRASHVDDPDYLVNPEPVPFMPSNFMSSTMLKKIPIPKRHQDTFGGYEYNFTGKRGVMMHTDRYQFEALRAMEGLNQRDRLLAEMAYLDHLRGVKRRREVVPHRAQMDMFLGGKKIECEERFDINREIQRLKAMAMPVKARDLFHGRGILLPPTHMSIVPRPPRGPIDDSDSEDEVVRISAPASLQRAPGESLALPGLLSPTFERQISLTLGDEPRTRSVVKGKRFNQLPSLAGSKTQTPRAGLQRDDTNQSRSGQSSNPPTSRSAAWVEEQNKILSRSRAGSPGSADSVTGTRLELQVHLPPGSRADDHHDDLETKSNRSRGKHAHVSFLTQGDLGLRTPDNLGLHARNNLGPAARDNLGHGTAESIGRSTPDNITIATRDNLDLGARDNLALGARDNLNLGLATQAKGEKRKSGESSPRGPGKQDRPRQDAAKQDGPEKRLSPEAPPPSTEGGARPTPHVGSGRQTSPPKSHTPNPLKVGMQLGVSEEQVSSLRQTFQRLDTDMDGHLQYHQLKSQLPKEFSQQQECFVKQVYDITHSSGAFFGVDEFLMMTQLTTRVSSLTGAAQEAYGKLNFDTLEAYVIKYVELFHSVDVSQKGRITVDALMTLLGSSQGKGPLQENAPEWNTILDSLCLDYGSQVSRIEYLVHIPLFMALLPPASPQPETQTEEQGLEL